MTIKQFFIGDRSDFLAAAAYLPEGEIRACAVFVHAYSNWKDEHDYMFCRMAHALAEGHTASLLFDMRGHGESAGLLEDVTAARMQQDIAAAVDYAKRELCAKVYMITVGFSARLCAEAVGNAAEGYVMLSPAAEIPAELRFLAEQDGKDLHTVLAGCPQRAAAEAAMERMGMLPRFVTAEKVNGPLFACEAFSGTPVSVPALIFGTEPDPAWDSVFCNHTFCPAADGGVMFRSPSVIAQITERIMQFVT